MVFSFSMTLEQIEALDDRQLYQLWQLKKDKLEQAFKSGSDSIDCFELNREVIRLATEAAKRGLMIRRVA